MVYAGTFSADLVYRSHVTPNACSAALNAFDASLRCSEIMAYSTSSGSACLATMPYSASARSLAVDFSAAFSPAACQASSRPLSASLRRFSSRAVPLSARFFDSRASCYASLASLATAAAWSLLQHPAAPARFSPTTGNGSKSGIYSKPLTVVSFRRSNIEPPAGQRSPFDNPNDA